MRKNNAVVLSYVLLLCIFLASCDATTFYEDEQDPGLSIFSDNSNNVMSCYVDSMVWKTFDRTFGGFAPAHYETSITRLNTVGVQDTLVLTWYGDFADDSNQSLSEIIVALPIAKNFTYNDFNNLQGKRITLDGTNGFFTSLNLGVNNDVKGTGNIYFHFAELKNISVNLYQGRMSGIFDADIGTIQIRKGRFDHEIDPSQVRF